MALGKATGNQKLLRSHRCSESRETSHYYVLSAVNFDASALTALIRSQQNRMQMSGFFSVPQIREKTVQRNFAKHAQHCRILEIALEELCRARNMM